jgi:hypothetical protein
LPDMTDAQPYGTNESSGSLVVAAWSASSGV